MLQEGTDEGRGLDLDLRLNGYRCDNAGMSLLFTEEADTPAKSK